MDSRVCTIDPTHKTYIDKINRPQWYKYNNQWICSRCRNKLILNPKWHNINNKKRIRFKEKIISIKNNPRKGYCSRCSNNIFDGSCKRTHMHHELYDVNNVLNNTIELCPKCHDKETWKTRPRIIKNKENNSCRVCDRKNKYYTKKGKEIQTKWYFYNPNDHQEGYICNSCYCKKWWIKSTK